MTAPIELIQFVYSHYNEKARWALDWKRLPHRRRTLLPGPHMPTVRRLTGGTQLPVVRFGDEVVAGSARILDELERRFPDPPLYPADPDERQRALGLQAYFDEEVGPGLRSALFSHLIDETGYLARTFAERANPLGRFAYRALLPLTKGLIRKGNAVTPERVAAGLEVTRAALDRVAKEAGPSGQLVGDRFTVADLAAAALLAPAARVEHPDMALPRPAPASVEAWYALWADHPGAAWVRAQYAKHRPASREIDPPRS